VGQYGPSDGVGGSRVIVCFSGAARHNPQPGPATRGRAIAFLVTGLNLLVDILYGWLDPRIRIQA